jgi:cellobiose phosphorylase
MQYGYFDDAAREYVVTTPKTPVKWINYIGTLAFGGFVDQTGGALLCKGDPALNRITKYIPQMPASDFKGTTLYLRARAPGAGVYHVFSPFFVPTLDPYDRYECHVGLGYSRIVSEFYGIRTEVTIFVPVGSAGPIGGSQELRDIRVTNLRAEPVEIDAVPVVEYTHPDALKQLTNADWVPQTMQSRIVAEPGGQKTLIQYPFMFRDLKINYFTASLPVASFESDRARFLGDHEYGTWAAPLALQRPELSDHETYRGDNIAALMLHLGVLQPGETRRVVTQLGQASSYEAALSDIERYRDPVAVDAALAEIGRFWDGYLGQTVVETPDPALNSMLNIHNPRQCHITRNWSRYLSLYQLGYGARGIGLRDSSQDVMAVVGREPVESKALIAKLLHVQRRNGSAMHQLNPLTMAATEGDAREREDRPQYYGDDHLWSVLAVAAYLKETGDLAFLDEIIPYYQKDRNEQPVESGTVLDHLRRAVEFTANDLGQHGFPLLGFADWNDTVNLPAGAESLFIANLYGAALREMIELMRCLGDVKSAERYEMAYATMAERVNALAWDGQWFVRYFDHDGTALGSHANAQGKIYANGQSWPVISGFATPERAVTALDSLRGWLNTRNGIKLSAPGFNGFDPTVGGITTYPPGAKENGGIFLHANPWVIIAETLVGRGDRAYEYFSQINPAAKNDRLDEYECEPYVYPQNVLGDEHPQFGLARNSWLSGTASWMYQAATQYILGIQPTYTGLKVAPVIPENWPGFTATRIFRGVPYRITVRRAGPGNSVVLRVDGQPVAGNIVPLPTADRAEVQVEAIVE